MLCRLNHPCVVRLLAVSLHPLCFVLELAPYGSLASVVDELSSKREAQEKDGGGVSRIRESILGRELSYKIAFQVNCQYILAFYLKNVKTDLSFMGFIYRGNYLQGGYL